MLWLGKFIKRGKNTKSIAGEEIIDKKKTQEDIDRKEEEHTRRRKNNGKQIKRKITIKRLNSNGEEEAVHKTNIINTDKENDIYKINLKNIPKI